MPTTLVKNLIIAAGGILMREDGAVLLVHRPRYDDWSFPKGKLDGGESPLETAIREVREETGFKVKVTAYVGAAGYPVKKHPKVVLFWLMEPQKQFAIQDTDEVDRMEWLPYRAAMRRLSYAMEKELLAKALAARESTSSITRGRP